MSTSTVQQVPDIVSEAKQAVEFQKRKLDTTIQRRKDDLEALEREHRDSVTIFERRKEAIQNELVLLTALSDGLETALRK